MELAKLKLLLIIILVFLFYIIIKKNEKWSDYIVLKLVIPNPTDMGGFAWHLHHVQCLLQLCEWTNKKPVIYFDKGYYFMQSKGPNWWNYYFKPILSNNKTNKIIKYGNNHGYHLIREYPLKNTQLPYLYDNKTFQDIMRPNSRHINFAKMYQKISLNNTLQLKVDNFSKKNFQDYYMIGIHYRGTDKFASYNDNEDLKKNRHFTYQEIIKIIKKHITSHSMKKIAIFIASDEQPFVTEMKKNFPKVISYDSYRSKISTSGLQLNTKHCVLGSTDKECLKLQSLQNESIHRGNNNITPLKKGEDAVMDIWLLAKCNELFRAHQGNFSSQPQRINPKLVVYNL